MGAFSRNRIVSLSETQGAYYFRHPIGHSEHFDSAVCQGRTFIQFRSFDIGVANEFIKYLISTRGHFNGSVSLYEEADGLVIPVDVTVKNLYTVTSQCFLCRSDISLGLLDIEQLNQNWPIFRSVTR